MLKLRQTLLNNYEVCPRIVLKDWGQIGEIGECEVNRQEHTNKYASKGTAIHETMEWLGIELKKNEKPTRLQIHDVLDINFAKIPIDLFENEEDKTEFYNMAHEEIDWLYEQYREVKPLLTEFTFDVSDIIPGINLPFNGTIDRVDGDIFTKHIELADYKTGKLYTKKDLASNIQATLYCLAWNKLYGFYPESFTFYFSKLKRTKKIMVTPEFIYNGIERIKSIYMKMELGEFEPPSHPNKYFCTHFCQHIKDCPRHKKVRGWEQVE